MANNVKKFQNINADPLTGEPGSHPIGTGVGGVAAASAGAALGFVGGPVGSIIGAIAGSVLGGIAGHGIAELVNPTEIDEYWREHYHDRPYIKPGTSYETYRKAYNYGYNARVIYPNKEFEEVEDHLNNTWEKARGSSNLEWQHARDAVRDSYELTDDLYNKRVKPHIIEKKDS